MTTSKGTEPAAAGQQRNTECCMCGDLGFPDQLFQCKVCQFRSQHRYCSNLYPKTEPVVTCNWCLSQREDSPNSSNSSSSYKNNGSTEDHESNKNRKIILRKGLIRGGSGGSGLQLQLQKPIIKKPKSPEAKSPLSVSTSPPSVLVSTRKRIVTNGALEERLRRTRSEDIIANGSSSSSHNNSGGATKHVFRNKVRRYKLLDEVSS